MLMILYIVSVACLDINYVLPALDSISPQTCVPRLCMAHVLKAPMTCGLSVREAGTAHSGSPNPVTVTGQSWLTLTSSWFSFTTGPPLTQSWMWATSSAVLLVVMPGLTRAVR